MIGMNYWKKAATMALMGALLVFASMVLVTTANAAILFEDNFEQGDDVLGGAPAQWNITKDDAYDAGGAHDGEHAVMEVAAGTPTGGSGGQVLKVKGYSKRWRLDTPGDMPEPPAGAGGILTYSYKFMSVVDAEVTTDKFRNCFYGKNNAGGTTYPYLGLGDAAGVEVEVYAGGWIPLNDMVPNHWYQAVETIDLDTDGAGPDTSSWSLSLDDLDDTSAATVYTGLPFSNNTEMASLNYIRLSYIDLNLPINFLFDDFVVEAVPEPSTFGLFGLALACVGLVRRRS